MKTQEIDGKKYVATTLGDGSLLLVPEKPKQRTPEAGDVWLGGSGSTWIISEDNTEFGTCLTSTTTAFPVGSEHDISDMGTLGGTYLGKFSEVYVKISDVQKEIVQIGPSYTSFSTSDLRKLGIVA
jgi:hypothetical protein